MKAKEKKYKVYYNDGVNEIIEMYAADTLDECKQWISEQLGKKEPVGDYEQRSDFGLSFADTFFYEVYDRPIVDVVDDEDIFNDPVYTSNYYYTK